MHALPCAVRRCADGVAESVYRSEAETGDRNRAITHCPLTVGAAAPPIEPALDPYLRQCSIQVTAAILARMGATLTKGGENPFTGESPGLADPP